jgi:hypothetical protein
MSETLRGLLRALTADAVGGPVDLATAAANLGIAGAGYVGHKTGMLKKPLPLIENPVGGSDWFAKNTPLEDTGSAQYNVGRVAGSLAPLAWGAAGKLSPKIRKGQTNALWQGGSDDLALFHSFDADNLPKKSNGDVILPKEFTHLSGAVMRHADIRPGDLFGENIAILNPRKIDPKLSPSVIKNRDFYSPRRSSSLTYNWPTRNDGGATLRELKRITDPSDPHSSYHGQIRDMANARIADKFYDNFPQAGARMEGESPPSYGGWGKLGERPLRAAEKEDPEVESGRTAAEIWSPRFQSFKHYEKSPMGAATLTNVQNAPHQSTAYAEDALRNALRNYVPTDGILQKNYRSWGSHPKSDWEQAKAILGYYNNSPKYLIENLRKLTREGRQFLGAGPFAKRELVRGSSSSWDDHYYMNQPTPQEVDELVKALRDVVSGVRYTPSQYAETKTFGNLPFNNETVAGMLVPSKFPGVSVMQELQNRGIPALLYNPDDGRLSRQVREWAVQKQNEALYRKR